MNVKKITVGIGVTINIGDYQSVRFDVSMEAEDDGSGYDQAKTLIRQQLDAMVREFGLVNPLSVMEDKEA